MTDGGKPRRHPSCRESWQGAGEGRSQVAEEHVCYSGQATARFECCSVDGSQGHKGKLRLVWERATKDLGKSFRKKGFNL